MDNLETQEAMVLDHLKRTGSITSMEAINLFHATRLSAIIFRLRRKSGHDIETTTMDGVHSITGRPCQYARYIYNTPSQRKLL